MIKIATEKKNLIEKRPRVVLVLGGGASRGIAHIGVLDVLQKAEVPIDHIVGCSVGAMIGALYCDGIAPKEILAISHKVIHHKYSMLGLPSLSKGLYGNGFFSVRKMHKMLGTFLKSRTFDSLQIPLSVVATCLEDGKIASFNEGELLTPICASAAVPTLFQSVKIGEKHYVDGGTLSTVPNYVAQKLSPHLIVASNAKGWQTLQCNSSFDNQAKRVLNIVLEHLDKEEEKQADVTIRPDLSGVMDILANVQSLDILYERGKKSTEEVLPKLQKLLQTLPY